AERVGIIRAVVVTEAATTLGILAVLASPLHVAYVVLVPLGVALNGTSSVLYGTVAELVTPERRSRAYGLYSTVTIAPSAIAPTALAPSTASVLLDTVRLRAARAAAPAAATRPGPPPLALFVGMRDAPTTSDDYTSVR